MKKTLILSLITLLSVNLIAGKRADKKQLKVQYYTYGNYDPVSSTIFIKDKSELPEGCVQIGSISVGENGKTPTEDCTYEACMKAIHYKAIELGANYVLLVIVKEPKFNMWVGGSTCYNIDADLYRITDNHNK